MQKIKPLLDQQQKKSGQGSNSSQIEAGRTSEQEAAAAGHATAGGDGENLDHADAISRLFMEFQFAYHNQFHKAFPNPQDVIIAKKFWLQSLAQYPAEVILRAGQELVRTQNYLPTIAAMITTCDQGAMLFGLPNVRSAYTEACMAPSPKRSYEWSHPVVYFAGQATDWFFLDNNPEQTTFPVFEHHYTRLCRQVMQGEELEIDAPPPLPEKIAKPLSKTELRKRLKAMRSKLGI